MTAKLKELEIREISVVDAPANPDAKILLFKRKEEESMAKKEMAAEVVEKQEVFELKAEDMPKVEIIDTEKADLQKRVAELEAAMAERDAAEKAAVEKAAAEKLATDNAEINAAFERLEKRVNDFAERVETSELMEVAAKYEILGEKPDELCATLKKMKTAGVYKDFIAKLDRELALVEKSGVFNEIGKKGFNSQVVSFEKALAEVKKNNPELSDRWARVKVFELYPELRD